MLTVITSTKATILYEKFEIILAATFPKTNDLIPWLQASMCLSPISDLSWFQSLVYDKVVQYLCTGTEEAPEKMSTILEDAQSHVSTFIVNSLAPGRF